LERHECLDRSDCGRSHHRSPTPDHLTGVRGVGVQPIPRAPIESYGNPSPQITCRHVHSRASRCIRELHPDSRRVANLSAPKGAELPGMARQESAESGPDRRPDSEDELKMPCNGMRHKRLQSLGHQSLRLLSGNQGRTGFAHSL
jgi:hypothetical protein